MFDDRKLKKQRNKAPSAAYLNTLPPSSSPRPPPFPQPHQQQAPYAAHQPWYSPPANAHVSQYQSQSYFPPYPSPQHGTYNPMPYNNYPPTMPPTSKGSPVNVPTTEDDIQRLLRVCQKGKGNASLLQEALVYAKPEDLKDQKGIIQEFYTKCRASQEHIHSQIPWATSQVERVRLNASGSGEIKEEKLLAELLTANEALLDALKMYDDLEHVGAEEMALAERKLRALTAITEFVPTPAESELVNRIFDVADSMRMGSVSTVALTKMLIGSGIPSSTVDAISKIANVEENNMLSRECVGVAIRLASHAQRNPGLAIDDGLVNKAAPLPTILGLEPSASGSGQQEAGPSTPQLPPLTPADRSKFLKIFFNAGPNNGVIEGNRAREIFMKSRLPLETLAQIWELADTQKQGALDARAFTVAMYLIQGVMSGRLKAIPHSLPQHIYEEASAQAALQYLQQSKSNTNTSSPSASGSSFSGAGPSSRTIEQQWDVDPELKVTADAFFDALDERGEGFIDDTAARAHFRQTGISEEKTMQIWKLVDLNGDGRLSRDEFAVALYLIREVEAGRSLPASLPPSLVPPSTRTRTSANVSDRPETMLINLDEVPPTPPHKGTSSQHSRSASSPSNRTISHILDEPSPPNLPPLPPRIPPIRRTSNPNQTTPTVASPPSPAFPAPGSSTSQTEGSWTWEITPEEKVQSDRFFDMLDPWKHGYVEADAVVPFMAKSKLPTPALEKIWDLADADRDGRLSRDDFAVVLHLIRAKLAGQDVPHVLPSTLVPPFPHPEPPAPNPADTLQSNAMPQGQTSNPNDTSASGATLASELSIIEEEPARSSTPPPPYESVPSNLQV